MKTVKKLDQDALKKVKGGVTDGGCIPQPWKDKNQTVVGTNY